jgi:four helix bundle protein
MAKLVRSHTDLEVFKKAFDVAMRFFELSKTFPKEETYSLTDQGRRSSRSVCANIAEAWRKRHYEAYFKSKLCDAEGEAAETQDWIQFAVRCGYVDRKIAETIYKEEEEVIRMLVAMNKNAEKWVKNEEKASEE